MIDYIKYQIQEIQQDWSLRFYGLALSLTHLCTYFYWQQNNFFLNSQSGINVEPICFPWFPDCDLFRQSLPLQSWSLILTAYLIVSALTVGFFSAKRSIGLAYFFLILVTLFKFLLHMTNYNFMGNYHYMIYWVIFAFLFFPHKKEVIKTLIVLFYLAAGFLKINIDWLSGAAMISSPYIGGQLLVYSLFYVVLLELIFVFGLLHQNRWVRWAVLLQFVGFHLFSWHIVGFFYPMVMFSLLSIFVLDEVKGWKETNSLSGLLIPLFSGKLSRFTYTTIIVFIGLQLIPFSFVDDPSLSGSARLSSLNMFDSKTHCHSLLVGKTAQGTIHLRGPMKNLGVRLKCDPLVYLNQAHQLCRLNKVNPELEQLSLTLYSKRVTEQKYKKVLDIKDVCSLSNPLWAEIGSGS